MIRFLSLLILLSTSLFSQFALPSIGSSGGSAGGGGMPSPTSRTGWWLANVNTQLYKNVNPFANNPTNGQGIVGWENQDLIANRAWMQLGGATAQPTWNSTAGTGSIGASQHTGTNQQFYELENDAGNATEPLSSLCANNACTTFTAVNITSNCVADTTGAAMYTDTGVMADGSGYWGVYCRLNVANTELCLYTFDIAVNFVCKVVTQNTWHVVMTRQDGVNIYISVDNGMETSTSTGNIGSIAGNVYLGQGFSNSAAVALTGFIGEVLTYNIAQSGAAFTSTYSYMTGKWH